MNGFRVALLVCGFLTFEADGGTIHVPVDKPTIQSAIDAAQPLDSIIVAPGTYRETINFLGKPIALRSSGGRDLTTIDATGILSSVVTCASGEGPDSVLDGFTITGGSGSLFGGVRYGGGMLNSYSSPTVINCYFRGNAATRGAGIANYFGDSTVGNCIFRFNSANLGGGLYNAFGNPTVTGCLFAQTSSGAGMYIFSPPGYEPQSNIIVRDCVFAAGNAGGGMVSTGGSLIVSHSTFESNPGGLSIGGGSALLANCTFKDNSGAGIYSSNGDVVVSDCTFSGNSGSGMFNESSGNRRVDNCTFTRNSATLPTGSGGGMFNGRFVVATVTNCAFSGNTAHHGGGMSNEDSDSTVTHCTFNGNVADEGGGIYNYQHDYGSTHVEVSNCTFIANRAGLWGGGMMNTGTRPTVTNCTFSANTAVGTNLTPGGGGMFGGGVVGNCIFWGDSPNEAMGGSIRFSDLQGGFPLGAGNDGGNFYVNPMFVRPPAPGPDGIWGGTDDDFGDVRLQSGSPCIDAGDPTYGSDPNDSSEDLDASPRIVGNTVDMGAFEFQGEPQYNGPDFDEDGIPDIHDFDIDGDGIPNTIDECDYTPLGITIDSRGRPLADMNRDCTVGLRDFAILQRDFRGPR